MRGLVSRGHDVHVAAHKSLQGRVEAVGATFEVLPNIADYDSTKPVTPEQERARLFNDIIFSEAFGRDVYTASRRIQPDVQLVDLFLLTSVIAARAVGAPFGLLTHTIFKFVEWFGGQYAKRSATSKAFAASVGYEAPATMRELIGEAPVIAATYRPFEPEASFPPGYLSAGPLREAVPAGDRPFIRRSPGKPLVLVSLSSSFMDQAGTLNTLCRAIAKLEVEAVVTTGDAIDPRSLEAGSNTHVVRFLPHDVLLPMTRLVVTHAGHGTVMAAVSYGVPLLLLPMGRDQPMVAARAAELGLGAIMDCHASAAEFASAIEHELADSTRQASCQAFLSKLKNHPGLEHAISVIEGMASSR